MTSSSTDPFATPGFRFYPTEEELLSFYLRHRLANTRPDVERAIPVVDVYNYHPSELQSMAGEASVRDPEQWFFFCPRAEREMHGGRPPRRTPSGYWKATGSPSHVFSSSNQVIGVKRTMVFYNGRAPTGTKTKWKMNEYKATVVEAAGVPIFAHPLLRSEFSVCRVYIGNGTLRSFDRRPLDISNGHQVVRQVAEAVNVNVNHAVFALQPSSENSNDSSSSGKNGSREIIHGSDAAAIDWNSLTAGFDFDNIDVYWTGA